MTNSWCKTENKVPRPFQNPDPDPILAQENLKQKEGAENAIRKYSGSGQIEPAKKENICKGVTEVIAREAAKPPESVLIFIDELAHENIINRNSSPAAKIDGQEC